MHQPGMPHDAPPGMPATVVPAGQVEGQPAHLRVTPQGVEAFLADGQTVLIPHAQLDLSAGGFDGTFVFVRRKDGAGPTITTGDRGFVPVLREMAGSLLAHELDKLSSHTRSHNRWRWVGIGVTLGFVFMILALIWSIPRLLARSVDALPTDVDRQLGDASFDSMQMEGPIVDDPVVVGFVEEIVERRVRAPGGTDRRVHWADRAGGSAGAGRGRARPRDGPRHLAARHAQRRP